MNFPKYDYQSNNDKRRYRFQSIGPKGVIEKMVIYTEIETKNIFNLAFGDYDTTTNTINDLTVTNNGDSQKVLATVTATIFDFIDKNPTAKIFATGSTAVRTRLYRMGITNNLS